MYSQVYEDIDNDAWNKKYIPFVDVEGSTTFINSNNVKRISMHDGEREE